MRIKNMYADCSVLCRLILLFLLFFTWKVLGRNKVFVSRINNG